MVQKKMTCITLVVYQEMSRKRSGAEGNRGAAEFVWRTVIKTPSVSGRDVVNICYLCAAAGVTLQASQTLSV